MTADAAVSRLQDRFRLAAAKAPGTPWPVLESSPADRFDRDESGLHPAFRGVQITSHKADVTFPTRANAPFHLLDLESGVAVDVALVGVTNAAAELAGGLVAYRSAYHGADVLQRPSLRGTEDYVWFETAPAVPEATYDLALNEKIAGVRLLNDGLEFLDRSGIARLQVAPPYLVDADGVRWAAKLSTEGCPESADAPGLATATTCVLHVRWSEAKPKYPAVLDPSWNSTGPLRVLILWDTESGGTTTLQTALQNDGMSVTLSDVGSDAYTGTQPDLTTFDAVILLNGANQGHPLPQAGQDALLSFVQRGGGLVHGEWSAQEAAAGALPDLQELVLLGSTGSSAGPLTLSKVPGEESHPVLANLPDSFVFEAGYDTGKIKAFSTSPATVLMQDADGNDAVAVRAFGLGHVVEFSHAGNYEPATGGPFNTLSNRDVQQLYANAIAWASQQSSPLPIISPTPNGKAGASCTSSFGCIGNGSANYCTDGVCCYAIDCGPCGYCGGATSTPPPGPGGCYPYAAGGTPKSSCGNYLCDGTSTYCPASCIRDSQCVTGTYCVNNTCQKKPNGTACGGNTECASGYCVEGYCCGSANPGCDPYVCGTSGCLTSCTTDANCAPTYSCVQSQCIQKYAQGAACTLNAQCQSGNCVDGFCCNTACSGSCDVCAASLGATANGTCTLTPGASGSPSCYPYYCNSTSASCPTSCNVDTDCFTGDYCNSSHQCVVKQSNGAACTGGNQCSTGFCVDGFCCNSACSGTCDFCAASLGASANGSCTDVAGVAGSPTSCAPYLCSSSSPNCPTACNTNADCTAGNFCNASRQCVPLQANGATCTTGTQCSSGNCVDGYCCNTACGGSCDFCAAALGATSNGTCTDVVGAAGSPSCSPYLCSSSSASCPTSCSTDSQCVAGDYCSGNQCVAKGANGAVCTGANQCASGNCVDGFCCNTTCNGSCDFCAAALGASANGTCTSVAGAAGSPSCSPYLCSASSASCPTSCTADSQCSSGNFCSGTTCVPRQANGATCTAATQCASGNCVDGFCCNTACNGSCDFCAAALGASANGTCTDVAGVAGSPSCSPYLCSASSASCPTSCTTDSQCVAGDFCNGSQCVAKGANGATCTTSNQCSSGFCADGFCCNSACNGACDVCSAALGSPSNGTCWPAPLDSAGSPSCAPYTCDGSHVSCATACNSDNDCSSGNYCNGSHQCAPAQANGAACTTTRQCSSGNCVDGFCCNTACNGSCDFCAASRGASANGVCTDVAGVAGSPSCSPYLCSASSASCPTSCTADSQCVAGDYCSGNQCVAKGSNGAACTSANQCASGFCADGFCCNTACSGACDVCSAVLGASANGTCSPARLDSPGSPSCAPYTCDGTHTTCATTCNTDNDCVSGDYCNASHQCVPAQANGATCTGSRQCSSGNCVDGFCCNTACSGSCDFCAASLGASANGTCTDVAGAVGSPSCAPYLCSASSASCPTSCTTDAQCNGGTVCLNNACAAPQANGAACTAANQCASGFCANGFCCNTACNGSCDVCSAALGSIANGTCWPSPLDSPGSPSCAPYTCDGNHVSCATTCSADADCSSGYFCNSAHQCALPQANGATCSAAKQCQSGNCVDGFCCNTACSGSCDFCAASLGASANGTCTDVGGVAGSPTCAPYLCAASSASCPTSCTVDSQCATGNFCLGGKCMAKQANGATCTSAVQCSSGFCADGICCNTACSGSCDVCSAALGATADGVCTASALDSPGNPSCAPYTCDGVSPACSKVCDTDVDCAPGNYCDPTRRCVPAQANGASCTTTRQCQSGNCADGFCCNTACNGSCDFCAASLGATANGTCTDVAGVAGSPSCSPYLCSASSASCPTSCTKDAQCVAGDFCNGSTCVAKLSNGGTCTSANQCASGNCVDGVCCNTACNGSCDACSVALGASVNGICAIVALDSPGSPSCAPYTCDGTHATCATTCNADSDCATGTYCNSTHQCVPAQANGATCSTARQCSSGNCADGFCCNTACSGSCDFCAASLGASANGTCTNVAGSAGSPSCSPYLCSAAGSSCPATCTSDAQCVAGAYCNGTSCVAQQGNGGACTANGQCTSGNCVDGVCCNTACGGSCDVCAASLGASADGICTVVAAGNLGAPSCGPYLCNGSSAQCPSSCAKDTDCASGDYCNSAHQCVTAETLGQTCSRDAQCDSGHCADGVCCNSACNGACDFCTAALGAVADGTCSNVAGSPGEPSCGAFLCQATNASCPTSCANDLQCAAGAYCSNSVCVPAQQNGATCAGGNQCASGNCVDGVCCNTACNGACDACSVAQGAATDGTCTPVASGSPGSPACAPYVCDGLTASCPMTCGKDTDCAAGNYCNNGACVPKTVLGGTCTAADQCASGNCADGVCCDTACDGACDVCAASLGAEADGTCTIVAAGSEGSPSCTPYACDGVNAACATSCQTDNDCATGNYCNDSNQCVPGQANGATCTSQHQCSSGNCVDGFCCDTACDGACDFCAKSLGAKADGTCSNVAGVAGTPSCSPYLCGATSASCPTGCQKDTDCVAGDFCSNGACVPKIILGGACTTAGQCASGNCVDGLCCNTACDGACDVCSASLGASADGTCTPVAKGSAGSPTCAPFLCDGQSGSCPKSCAADGDCAANAFCNAMQQCVSKQTLGSACTATDQCGSGFCVDGFCCDSACDGGCNACAKSLGAAANGTCTVVVKGSGGTNPSCNPYLCDGQNAACPNTCQKDADCVAGDFCSGGQCVPKQQLGATCSATDECASGFCVDGVCCNTACTDQCAACNVGPNPGTCSVAPVGAPIGKRMACATDGSACGGACDGVHTATCTYPDPMTTCGQDTCANDRATPAPRCDGQGACQPSAPVDCPPYACGPTSCLTECMTDHDCSDGHYCKAGACVVLEMQGDHCDHDGACATGHCVDDVCCDSGCEGACGACNLPGHAGTCSPAAEGATPKDGDCSPIACDGTSLSCPLTCTSGKDCQSGFACIGGRCAPPKPPASTCTTGSDCESGFCADGVCCNSACDGACNSCALPGHEGTCELVTGAPAAGHSCTGTGSACGGTCDGTSPQCAYPAKGTSCSPAFCSDATAFAASTCDGAGTCAAGAKTACVEGCQGDHCAPLPKAKGGGCASSDGSATWLAALLLGVELLRRRRAGMTT